MTDKASPEPPKEEPDLARFLQGLTPFAEELRPSPTPRSMAAHGIWRAAMATWMGASTMGMPRSHRVTIRRKSRAQAAVLHLTWRCCGRA